MSRSCHGSPSRSKQLAEADWYRRGLAEAHVLACVESAPALPNTRPQPSQASPGAAGLAATSRGDVPRARELGPAFARALQAFSRRSTFSAAFAGARAGAFVRAAVFVAACVSFCAAVSAAASVAIAVSGAAEDSGRYETFRPRLRSVQ